MKKRPLLITGWCGPEFAGIANSTLPIMERYAEKHGMDYLCVNLHSNDAPPSWVKIPRLISALRRNHETCIWLDADVVIFDSSKSILDDVQPDRGYVQALVEHDTECGHVPNCGVWVVSQAMLATLELTWASRDKLLYHPWWEQASIMLQMGYRVNHVPESVDCTPTELHDRTCFLPPKWNHHPKDARRVDDAAFIHVTQYLHREEACEHYASHAT